MPQEIRAYFGFRRDIEKRREDIERLKPPADPIRAKQQASLRNWRANKRRKALKRALRDVALILIFSAAFFTVLWSQT